MILRWLRRKTHIDGVVESQALIKSTDGLDLTLVEIKASDVQVLRETALVIALGNNSNSALSSPAEEHLSGSLPVLLGNTLDCGMVEEEGGILGTLHVKLDEAQGSEGGVRGDGNSVLLGVLNQRLLSQVWVVFNLEGSWGDAGVAEHVHDELDVEITDADATDELLVDKTLHGGPGLLSGGIAVFDLVTLVEPSWGVADSWIHVFESDGKVDDEEIEVVDAPVGQLLPADWLDMLGLVERLPELGDDEELLPLHDPIFDSTSNSLSALLLVAIVCDNP